MLPDDPKTRSKAHIPLKRKASNPPASPPPRKQRAVCTKPDSRCQPAENATPECADSTPTKRLTIKLRGQSVILPATLQQDSKKQPSKQRQHCPNSAVAATAVLPLHAPHAQAMSVNEKAGKEHKCFRAAVVERPVTRRFKLQQSTKIRVRLKLTKNDSTSAVGRRVSTLKHQHKRHISFLKPQLQQDEATLPGSASQQAMQTCAASVSQEDGSVPSSDVVNAFSSTACPSPGKASLSTACLSTARLSTACLSSALPACPACPATHHVTTPDMPPEAASALLSDATCPPGQSPLQCMLPAASSKKAASIQTQPIPDPAADVHAHSKAVTSTQPDSAMVSVRVSPGGAHKRVRVGDIESVSPGTKQNVSDASSPALTGSDAKGPAGSSAAFDRFSAADKAATATSVCNAQIQR